MGFSLKKLFDQAVAQVNPFDGGKTAATVAASYNKPAPAVTAPPNSGLRVVNQPAQNLSVQNAPAQNVAVKNTPTPAPLVMASPKAPDLHVGNTVVPSTPETQKIVVPEEVKSPYEKYGQPILDTAGSLISPAYNTGAAIDDLLRLGYHNMTGNNVAADTDRTDLGMRVDGVTHPFVKLKDTVSDIVKSDAAFLTKNEKAYNNANDAFNKDANDAFFIAPFSRMASAEGTSLGIQSIADNPNMTDEEKAAAIAEVSQQYDGTNLNLNDSNGTATRKIMGTALEAALNVAMARNAEAATENVGRLPFTERIMPSVSTGAKLGAANTVPQILQMDNPTVRDAVNQLATNTAAGAAMPLITGGGAELVKGTMPKLITYAKENPDLVLGRGNEIGAVGRNVNEVPEVNPLVQKIEDAGKSSGIAPNNLPKNKPNKMSDAQIISRAEDAYINYDLTPAQLEKVRKNPSAYAERFADKPVTEPVAQAPKTKQTDVKLNTERLAVSDEAKARLNTETQQTIDRLSNKDLKEIAKHADIDFKSYGVEGTKKKITEQLNLRNEIMTIEKKIEDARAAKASPEEIASLMKQSAELGRAARSQGTDLARQLQARRILANEIATPQQKVFRLLDEAGVNPDAYTGRFATVDMNNPVEVVKAYRELVPPKFSDWLDKYRYTNMLSSPLTHVVNIASNAEGLLGVSPVEKLFAGGIDAVRAAVTGTERTRFASEAGSYFKGSVKAIPEAFRVFRDVMRGKSDSTLPDVGEAIRNGKLAYGGVKGAADSVLSFIPKLLGASDEAGITISKAGERAALEAREIKGIKVPNGIENAATEAANYRLFHDQLNKAGQGHLLDAVDFIPQVIQKGRNSKSPIVRTISKWTIPFVQTPVNIFKQGIEYSPAGYLTMIGNMDKVSQAAKATMGTTVVTVAAATLAANHSITFAEPTDAKERDAFRAEGKQAYSVKIGGKWYSYSKLHPALSFNLAVVGAVADANEKGNITDSQANRILNTAGGILGFFRDQSYMKSVGDFTNSMQLKDAGDIRSAFSSLGGNYANQLVPFKSLVSWVGRQVDNTQRKVDTKASSPEQIWQGMIKDIPGLNKSVPARKDPYTGENVAEPLDKGGTIFGVPVKPSFNALNPVRATTDKGYGTTTGLNLEQRMIQQEQPQDQREKFRQDVVDQKAIEKQATAEKNAIKDGKQAPTVQTSSAPSSGTASTDVHKLSNGKYYAKIGEDYKTYDTEQEANDGVAKYNTDVKVKAFKDSGAKSKEIDGQMWYKKGDGTYGHEDAYDYKTRLKTSDLDRKLDTAKNDEDYATWRDHAVRKYQLLYSQLQHYDPETEPDKINKLQGQISDLVDNMAKYNSYGGAFTKPKSARSRTKSSNGLDYKLFNPSDYGKSLRSLLAAARVG